MTQQAKSDFQQILAHSHIAHPYPLYAQFREIPVALQADGSYLVSTYNEIVSLLHDPRISSDMNKSDARKQMMEQLRQKQAEAVARGETVAEPMLGQRPSFIFQDPPQHDRLRRLVMSEFTPERILRMGEQIEEIVKTELDKHAQRGQIDIVDDLAYPLPVTIICHLLGVPRQDESRFHVWSEKVASALDPGQAQSEEQIQELLNAARQMREYLGQLLRELQENPGDNLLSGLLKAQDVDSPMSPQELVATAQLLLIAGHETTVNLITNGTLALLRSPQRLEQLRQDPELVVPYVEELLRYDPPVQFRTRTALADIEIAGVRIPPGATIILVLASGNHDERRFEHPDDFMLDRQGNEHLGFGSGLHYCVGAPLARVEAHIALREISRRLIEPRMVIDPPPYRENAALRGPRHLLVTFQRMRD